MKIFGWTLSFAVAAAALAGCNSTEPTHSAAVETVQARVVESQVNYWRAVYGNAEAYAQLLYATGTLTPEAAEGLQ